MKHKLAYSPQDQKPGNGYATVGGRSPIKATLFQSTRIPQDIAFRQSYNYISTIPDISSIRPVPEQTEFMRHTMNPRLAKRLGNLNWEEEEKPNKIEDLLRQTMSHKSSVRSTRAIRQEISKEIYQKATTSQSTLHQVHLIGGEGMSAQLPEVTRSMQDLGTLSKEIDRNKKLIESLRKTGTYERDLLKNVNHNKSPSYIDLEQKERPFRKKQPPSFFTPQTNKDSQLTRLKSSPNIEVPRSAQKSPQFEAGKKKWHPQCIKSGPSFSQFEQGKKLGEGKFGVVTLAKSKRTGGVFALKKVPKAMIKSHMMVDQLSLELRIQSCVNHRNILGMYGFFEDKTHLFIVLEYMDGGTLYEQLKNSGKISQKETASIIRQITSAIDYLHDIGIAHRDLKPENVVISNHVYKLCDFGWAALCDQRRKTYCGTFDYVAPEILEGAQYDMTVDLWCLGVLTFELLTGKAPFYHISRKQTMKRILNVNNQQIQFPQTLSAQAKDFIEQLVRKDPNERIKAADALKHPFLQIQQE